MNFVFNENFSNFQIRAVQQRGVGQVRGAGGEQGPEADVALQGVAGGSLLPGADSAGGGRGHYKVEADADRSAQLGFGADAAELAQLLLAEH